MTGKDGKGTLDLFVLRFGGMQDFLNGRLHKFFEQ